MADAKTVYNADKMRMGKTPQAVRAAFLLQPERAVIVCPAIARGMWQREWIKWGEHQVPMPQIYSYDALIRNPALAQQLRRWQPNLVIADEAHYLKSPAAARTQVMLGNSKHPGLLQLAEHAWLLSASPMPNNPTELYAPMSKMRPELLKAAGLTGGFEGWRDTFCHWSPTQYGFRVHAVKNADLLKSMLFDSGFMFQRTPADVGVQMPALNWSVIEHEGGTEDQHVELANLESDMTIDQREEPLHFSTHRQLVGQMKVAHAAERIMEDLDNGLEKVVVVAYHRAVLDALRILLKKYGLAYVDGSTTDAMRNREIDAFQSDARVRVFLAQMQTMMVSVSLSASNYIEMVERFWSPGDNEQLAMRCSLIGKQEPIFIRVHTLADSLDAAQAHTLVAKTQMRTEVGI